MIQFQAFGVAFKLPLLALIMPILSVRLGMQGDVYAIIPALWIHEIAHILAAKAVGVQIVEIKLMPFGGSARMENPYQLPARRIIPVAAAGSIANLCMAMLAAFAAHWNWIRFSIARSFVRVNLLLLLFNLIPALPLDGGRILYAILTLPLGEEKALRIGLNLGRLLAAALLGCAFWGGIHSGYWNITLILAAIFIVSCEADERRALLKSRALRLEELLRTPDVPQSVRLYQLDENTPLQNALALLRAGEGAWFVLLRDGKPQRLLDAKSIVCFLMQQDTPQATLQEVPNGLSLHATCGAEASYK